MHTEVLSTLSNFTAFEPPSMHGPIPASGTLAALGAEPAQPVIVMFSEAPAEETGELLARVSEMEERMRPKDELLFAPTIDHRLKVHTPFRVRIARSNEGVSAWVTEIDEFGYGTNRGEALDDLGKTIAELYFSLVSQRDSLSSDLAGVLKSLEGHISQVHA